MDMSHNVSWHATRETWWGIYWLYYASPLNVRIAYHSNITSSVINRRIMQAMIGKKFVTQVLFFVYVSYIKMILFLSLVSSYNSCTTTQPFSLIANWQIFSVAGRWKIFIKHSLCTCPHSLEKKTNQAKWKHLCGCTVGRYKLLIMQISLLQLSRWLSFIKICFVGCTICYTNLQYIQSYSKPQIIIVEGIQWTFFTEDILTCHSRKSTNKNNTVIDGWIPLSCFSVRVLVLFMLAHSHSVMARTGPSVFSLLGRV